VSAERTFCTLFDRNYLWMGVCLHASLVRHVPGFSLHVLCMDDLAHEVLTRLALPGVTLIRLSELEDEALLRVKPTRTAGEYCWTCTAALVRHVLSRNPGVDLVTYLDADLFFYGGPGPVFDEIGAAPIAIHEHRFPPRLASLEKAAGKFNVGWVSFRRDPVGLACVERWREQCLAWCFGRLEDGKFGDQMYLDEWPGRYPGLHMIASKGAGLGPWNVERYRIARGADGVLRSDEDALVFYHFHGLRLHEDGTTLAPAEYELAPAVRELVYAPYLDELARTRRRVEEVAPGFRHGIWPRPAPLPWYERWLRRRRFNTGVLRWLGVR
jgi:hypothetical protein